MSRLNILDASAVLARFQEESGRELVDAALDSGPCCISAVNACEVLTKLCEKDMPLEVAEAALNKLELHILSFDTEAATLAASLRIRTKPIGASLGDRACLALAERIALTGDTPVVYTAERAWTKIKWPFKVVAIR